MKTIGLLFTQVLVMVALAGNVGAHVSLDYPLGGETLIAGETIVIKWRLAIMHNQQDWDLFFSPDGGASWQPIASGLAIAQQEYFWIVPRIETSEARIRVVQDNVGGDYSDDCDNFSISLAPTSVAGPPSQPRGLMLHPNFPNPFNPETTIRYEMPDGGSVYLAIYNQLGQKVRTLVNASQAPGIHSVTWDGRDSAGGQVASGVYLYFLRSGTFSQSRKMLLLR